MIRALKFAHESLNCKTGWTSCPPPLQGGKPFYGRAMLLPLNQDRGALPPCPPPSCAPDAVPSFWIGPADTWFMAMSEDVCRILHLF